MSTAIPTLTAQGWAQDPSNIMTKMFHYAAESDYSQSTINLGDVCSIKYIFATHAGDITGLVTALRTALYKYYSMFSDLNVQVSSRESTTDNEVTVSVDILGTLDGIECQLSQLITSSGSAGENIFIEEFTQ